MAKYSGFCFLVILVLGHAQASPECPDQSPTKEYYPDPQDCGSYYECYEGDLSHHSCNAGNYWNSQMNECEISSSVNCGTRPTSTVATTTSTTTTSKPTTTTTTAATTTSSTTTAKPTTTTTSTTTTRPTTTTTTTSTTTTRPTTTTTTTRPTTTSTTTPKPTTIITTEPPTTSTPKSTTTTQTPNTTTKSPATTPSYDPDPTCPTPSNNIIFYPDPRNCKQYFECNRGKRFTMLCPGELFWNVKANACDYYEHVDCAGRSTPSVPSTTTPSSTYEPCKDKADGDYAGDPNDCTVFYECVGGSGVARHCEDGLYWCQENLTCDYLNVDGCTCFKL